MKQYPSCTDYSVHRTPLSTLFHFVKSLPLLLLAVVLTYTAEARNYEIDDLGSAYSCHWLGNTYGGLPNLTWEEVWGIPTSSYANGRFVPTRMEALFVLPDGTCFTNSMFSERSVEASIFRDGEMLGACANFGGFGRSAGTAVAADDNYIYVAASQGNGSDNPGVNKVGQPSYPPASNLIWHGFRRFKRDLGSLAIFDDGYSKDANFVVVSTKDLNVEPNIFATLGLAHINGSIYVSIEGESEIKVYDAANLSQAPSMSFSFVAGGLPGKMAVDDQNNLWIQDVNNRRYVAYSASGNWLNKTITIPQDIEANGFAIAPAGTVHTTTCLLVADGGPDNNIKICRDIYNNPVWTGSFGVIGGVFAGTQGQIGPQRFLNPTGVGIDSAGRIYVTENHSEWNPSGGAVISCHTLSGSLVWKLEGLEFVDCADIDPNNPEDIYTAEGHYRFDWQGNAGNNWDYVGTTMHPMKYPDDYRGSGGMNIRRINGHKMLFLPSMLDGFCAYRFSDDELAVPYAQLSANRQYRVNKYGVAIHGSAPQDGYLWIDEDRDGKADANEYTALQSFMRPTGIQIMDNGTVHFTNGNKTLVIPVTSAPDGLPEWDLSQVSERALPSFFNNVKRSFYLDQSDQMILSGYTNDFPEPTDTSVEAVWKKAGKVIAMYDNWSGQPSLRWWLEAPWDDTADREAALALSAAGDYLFVVIGSKSKADELTRRPIVFVYKLSDGQQVGTMQPGGNIYDRAMVDIPYAINARKVGNEYVVFCMEDAYGKVIMYRYSPGGGVTAQSPYSGSPHSLPGIIEVEDYDLGGEGVAYHDTSSGNSGGKYRSDDVDIESCSAGGYNVGWTAAGEWLEYTVNIPAGTYDIKLNMASPNDNKTVRVVLGGTVLGEVDCPNESNNWQDWKTATLSSVTVSSLMAGNNKILRLEMVDGGYNFNRIEFLSAGSSGAAIEAEDYDGLSGLEIKTVNDNSASGGQKVGYIKNGDWTRYNSITLDGIDYFEATVASGGSGGTIEVRRGGSTGTLLGSCTVNNTGNWSNWATVNCGLSASTGTYDLYLKFTGGGGYLFDLDVFTLGSGSSGATSVHLNSGGSGVADWQDDTGGSTYSVTKSIDTSVAGSAPEAVYQTERYGNFGYTFSDLNPGATYTVRLHFAELFWTAAGKRKMDVLINSAIVLNDYDIYAVAGVNCKAVIEVFSATANANGEITVDYVKVLDNAKCSGIEIIP